MSWLYGFELIRTERKGGKGVLVRHIVDGYCIDEKFYNKSCSKFCMKSLKIKLGTLCNYLNTGNYEEPIPQVNGFEIIENLGGENNIGIRFLKNGSFIENPIILENIPENQKEIIVKQLKFLCRLNYKISRKEQLEMKKNGEKTSEISYLEMKRIIANIIKYN